MAALLPFALSSAGCGEEVGPCDDPKQGRDTVLVGDSVQFGGQAIMNLACASCHSSTATGAARRGAPAGLDFDLFPLDPEETGVSDGPAVNEMRQTFIRLKPSAVAGLRDRQRRIFEDRYVIFQQVKDGLMPPQGKEFDVFRALSRIVGTAETSPCTADVGPFAPLSRKSSRDVLRKWLACRAPVVEVNSSELDEDTSSSVASSEVDGGVLDGGFVGGQVAGSAGYQYPACEPTGGGVSFDELYADIFGPSCATCHSAGQQPDFSSADSTFRALVEDTGIKCQSSGKPYVTQGDPARSYLYELVSEPEPCGGRTRMPPGQSLSAVEQSRIAEWIRAGAPRASAPAAPAAPLLDGLDAGVR